MMLPILRIHADGVVRSNRETYDQLAQALGVTEEERSHPLPSGAQPMYDNRANWALVYLMKAGLLERRGRGQYVITDLGRKTLKTAPDRIDMRYLKKFPAYNEWKNQFGGDQDDDDKDSITLARLSTPLERIAEGYTQSRAALADETLARVKSCSPRFFEKLVVELLVKMGYGGSVEDAGKVVGRSGDGGIDGIIKEDKLGLDMIYVQAKRWKDGLVDVGSVRDFSGSLDPHGAKKGVFITTSTYTKEARSYAENLSAKKIVLIDGYELAQLMIDHDIGVSTVTNYTIKRLDSDYFEE